MLVFPLLCKLLLLRGNRRRKICLVDQEWGKFLLLNLYVHLRNCKIRKLNVFVLPFWSKTMLRLVFFWNVLWPLTTLRCGVSNGLGEIFVHQSVVGINLCWLLSVLQEILTFFAHYHRMISLALYLVGFIMFVLSLVKYHYRLQFYMVRIFF